MFGQDIYACPQGLVQTSNEQGLISTHSSLSNEIGWFTMPGPLMLCFTSLGHNGFINHIVYCRLQSTNTHRQPSISNSSFCKAQFRMGLISQEPLELSLNFFWKSPVTIMGGKDFSVLSICVCVLLAKWPRLNWVADGWNWLKENLWACLFHTQKQTQFMQRFAFSVAPC